MPALLTATAVLGGSYLALTLRSAPNWWEWCGLLMVLLWALFHRHFPTGRRIIAFFSWGFLSAHLSVSHYVQHRLPVTANGQEYLIEGTVRGAVYAGKISYRFTLAIARARLARRLPTHDKVKDGELPNFPPRLRVSWYSAPSRPQSGDRMVAVVRVRPPIHLHSDAGFNRDNHALIKRHYGSAYIRRMIDHRSADPYDWRATIDRWRFALSDRIEQMPGHPQAKALITALANGDRRAMSDSSWRLLNRSGTSHLMAISGLHIGLFSVSLWQLLSLIFSLKSGASRVPRIWPIAVITLTAATVYALLCGMGLPTQRALVMLAAFLLAQFFARSHSTLNALAWAFVVVVLCQPATILSAGLWLSFGAVLCLLLLAISTAHRPTWWRWLYLQPAINLLLLPICLLWFSQAALTASLANLIAIPLVCFIILPLVWLSIGCLWILPTAGQWLFGQSFALVELLLDILHKVVSWPISYVVVARPDDWTLLFAWLGIVILLIAPLHALRPIGIVLCLPLLLSRQPDLPDFGQLQLTMLDVGQGQAVVVRTRHHVLLYDTGKSYGSFGSAGGRIVVPWLQRNGIGHLNQVLVSHFDDDHAGGLGDISRTIPVETILSNDPLLTKIRTPARSLTGHHIAHRRCMSGQSWRWDKVQFEILWPAADRAWPRNENNRSCVLKISTHLWSVVITGDADSAVEKRLLRQNPELQSDIIVVGHHGSRFSTHSQWLEQLQPSLGLISAGYLNRWGMPTEQVLARLHAARVAWLSTGLHGTVTAQLDRDGIKIASQAERSRPYWYSWPTVPAIECRTPIEYPLCIKSFQPADGSRGSSLPVR